VPAVCLEIRAVGASRLVRARPGICRAGSSGGVVCLGTQLYNVSNCRAKQTPVEAISLKTNGRDPVKGPPALGGDPCWWAYPGALTLCRGPRFETCAKRAAQRVVPGRPSLPPVCALKRLQPPLCFECRRQRVWGNSGGDSECVRGSSGSRKSGPCPPAIGP